jgi:hypothetical protein
VADMICTHLFGIRRFLRIGFGVDEVGVAFCIICSDCMEKLSISDEEDELRQVKGMAKDENVMREIETQNLLVKIGTFHMAMRYTPLIEVGRKMVSVK